MMKEVFVVLEFKCFRKSDEFIFMIIIVFFDLLCFMDVDNLVIGLIFINCIFNFGGF